MPQLAPPVIQLGYLKRPLNPSTVTELSSEYSLVRITATLKVGLYSIMSGIESLNSYAESHILGKSAAVLVDIEYQVVGAAPAEFSKGAGFVYLEVTACISLT